MLDRPSTISSNTHRPDDGHPDRTISLKPLLDVLTDYRRVIGAAAVVAALVSTVGVLMVGLLLPRERTASIGFRLLFDGATDGLYANRTPFSPADIVATPVLNEVYRSNDLQRYGGYEAFKESIAVLQSSLERSLLDAAYAARLADSKLTPVDRARLEDEYRKKREAIRDPVYSLTLRRHERFKAVPAGQLEKVLNDVLATWARQADETKGTTHFNIPVFSRSALSPDILEEDFLMAADGLRIQARRAADVCEQLLLVPGATTIRTTKDKISLTEVRFAIRDTLRNQIEPIVYLIQERGLTNDPRAMAQYLHGRVVELRLERDATQARIRVLQDALQGYLFSRSNRREGQPPSASSTSRSPSGLDTQTVIPQFSDSFLDRLIEMSTKTQAADVEYRQKLSDSIIKEGTALAELERSTSYYEGLERRINLTGKPVAGAQAEAMRADLRKAYEAIGTSVDRLAMLYEELSAQRLNPAASMFAVTDPFSQRTRYALPLSIAIQMVALTVLLALLVTPVACAWHARHHRLSR
jgi:hypothetical protein